VIQGIKLAVPLHTSCVDASIKQERTLKIEKDSPDGRTTIRLIGRLQSEHIEYLRKQLQNNEPHFVLDLEEVTLVDVEVVGFLRACEAEGVEIVHCSPFIREWMVREGKRQEQCNVLLERTRLKQK
jgi:hypothetical protein